MKFTIRQIVLAALSAMCMWSQQPGATDPVNIASAIFADEEEGIIVEPSLYSVCMNRCEIFQAGCFNSGKTLSQCASQYLNCIRGCEQYKNRVRPPIQSIPPVVGSAPLSGTRCLTAKALFVRRGMLTSSTQR
jgi:hypothetical protein